LKFGDGAPSASFKKGEKAMSTSRNEQSRFRDAVQRARALLASYGPMNLPEMVDALSEASDCGDAIGDPRASALKDFAKKLEPGIELLHQIEEELVTQVERDFFDVFGSEHGAMAPDPEDDSATARGNECC
jgi:hypothetical protein